MGKLASYVHMTEHDNTCSFPSGLCVVVLQSGDQIFHPGDEVLLNCSLGSGSSMSSHTMLWYQQSTYGAQMEFLTKEYDPNVGHFQSFIEPTANTFSLQISELLLNDSSTYYCAASHSAAHKLESLTNIGSGWRRWQTVRKEVWFCGDPESSTHS